MEESGLNKYLDEIGRESLLSVEEERTLSERIRQGDERALNRLVEANLRFVVSVANQYKGKGLQMEDLVSEGNIGLLKAAGRFDASKGTRFVNYAVVHVRQQIEKAISQLSGLYQLPRDVKQEAAARLQSYPLSVDAPLGHRTNMSLLSVIVNQDAPLADERVHSEAIEDAIEYALGVLDERESRVVNAYFGINQEHETMAEIAEDMDLKRERVRQIREKAVRKLRKAYKSRLRELKNNHFTYLLTTKQITIMKKKFICAVCGYIYEGDAAPEKCPICKAPASKFSELKDDAEMTYATVHKIGDGKPEGVSEEMIQDLRNHFNGECSEVGMYLAMARQADREGYPEIAEAFKRYAFEEADHASRFAELLGECVWDTKTNLEKRAAAEAGACEDKFRIAKNAKAAGFDAIHDTVHEMAKDEARHGAGFAGLLKRYFGK